MESHGTSWNPMESHGISWNLRRWHRAGFDQGNNSVTAATITNADVDAVYQLCDWDHENENEY
jgi:hypothetical protein